MSDLVDRELSLFGPVIKTAYEAETDTNAFTDAEKSKLAAIEAAAEVNNISDGDASDLTDGSTTDLHLHANRDVVNVTDATLTILTTHHGKCLDCYRATAQTLPFDTLGASNDGAEVFISKMGVGDVTVILPGSVTYDGSDQSITLKTIGYECRLRYNHTRLLMVITYSGEIS